MNYRNRTLAGSLLFVAGIVDVLGIAVGESFGSGFIWNLSVLLFGLLVVAIVYFIQDALNSKVFSLLLLMAG